MNHPFKTGDWVVTANGEDLSEYGIRPGAAVAVKRVYFDRAGAPCVEVNTALAQDCTLWARRFVAVPQAAAATTGHLPDGSSVQKHRAGPIYPCVIRLRDQRLGGGTLFDYGVTSPRNQEPLWLSTLEAATALANIINKDLK